MPITINKIDTQKPLRRIRFLIPGLIPYGYVSFFVAREGIGKTMLGTGLAWQMTRPGGGEFIGRPVTHGPAIYLNTDAADGEGRPVRYWLEQHQAAYPDGDMDRIEIYESTGAGLSPDDFAELQKRVEEIGAKCIIIDSYMATFPGTDSNQLSGVMKPLLTLRDFAAQTDSAVIVTDHLPKRAAGEKDGDRGIIGSVGKAAQTRSYHIITRVPSQEMNGREVLCWDVRKMSFGQQGYSMGLEIHRTVDVQGEAVSVRTTLCDLPDGDGQATRSSRAVLMVASHLRAHAGLIVSHAALIDLAMTAGGLQQRAAQDAVRQAISSIETLETLQLPGPGAPKAYRFTDPASSVGQPDDLRQDLDQGEDLQQPT